MPKEINAKAFVRQDERGKYDIEIGGDKHFWQGELSRFGPDEPVVINIKKWYKKRSLKQNSLFHAYIGIMADYFGYAPDTMKQLVGLKWLQAPLQDAQGNEMIDVTTGEVLFEIRSTASLNTLEMAELTDAMRTWAMEGWSIKLPLPEENISFNFKQ